MGEELNTILKKILNMPQQQRAFIAERLIDSLDQRVEKDIEVAWQQEVHKRVLEAKEGKVNFLSWEEVRRQLRGE